MHASWHLLLGGCLIPVASLCFSFTVLFLVTLLHAKLLTVKVCFLVIANIYRVLKCGMPCSEGLTYINGIKQAVPLRSSSPRGGGD